MCKHVHGGASSRCWDAGEGLANLPTSLPAQYHAAHGGVVPHQRPVPPGKLSVEVRPRHRWLAAQTPGSKRQAEHLHIPLGRCRVELEAIHPHRRGGCLSICGSAVSRRPAGPLDAFAPGDCGAVAGLRVAVVFPAPVAEGHAGPRAALVSRGHHGCSLPGKLYVVVGKQRVPGQLIRLCQPAAWLPRPQACSGFCAASLLDMDCTAGSSWAPRRTRRTSCRSSSLTSWPLSLTSWPPATVRTRATARRAGGRRRHGRCSWESGISSRHLNCRPCKAGHTR